MIRSIETLDLLELQPYRTLRRPEEHKQQGIFVAEGAKVVERLLRSDLSIVSMLMTEAWYHQLFPTPPPPFDVFLASKSLLQTIVGFPLHQGIMAVARVPAEKSLQEILPRFQRPFLFVALEGIVSAENVGVIVRNASAFGATAILSGESSSSPYLRRAVRNSMGTVFKMPIVHSTNLLVDMKYLASACQTTIIGADPAGLTPVHEAPLAKDACLVFGNEGEGLTESAKALCHFRVAIPMLNETDSLNVASASAVLLYEARRARSMTKC